MSTLIINKENVIYDEMISMATVHCCSCGIQFAVPVKWRENRIADKERFYCPNGHGMSYTKEALTDKEIELRGKLRKLEEEKRDAEIKLRDSINAERFFKDKWNEKLTENKKLKKDMKRVHNGVCPCCNRTFVNLQRHMETMHPEVVKK